MNSQTESLITTYIWQGFGVFVGIIAGTIITLLVDYQKTKIGRKNKLKNLKYELVFINKKIDQWLEKLTSYRNAVNSEMIKTYTEHLDLVNILRTTYSEMLSTGLLYEYLDHEDIQKLQEMYSLFSTGGDELVNKYLNEHKINFDKQVAAFEVNYWEHQLKKHKTVLNSIIKKLNK